MAMEEMPNDYKPIGLDFFSRGRIEKGNIQ
jgi:hypothetical protein